jgi:hypothetical protein
MANKLQGVIVAGTTSYSTDILLLSATDGSELVAKVAADVTAYYWRQGGTPTAISLSDLAAIDSAFSSGGIKEADATNMKGSYRLDVPNAAIASGADWVELNAFCTGSQVYKERFPIVTAGAVEVKVDTAALVTAVGLLPTAAAVATAVWAAGTRTLTAFSQGFADLVWASATRTLSAFGFTVNLASSVWDETAASHNTAGSTGEKLNAAASAGDPWSTTLPGAYGAGTAGLLLSGLAGDVWDELTADHVGVGTTGVAVATGGASGDPWSVALPGAYAAGTAGQIVGDKIAAQVTGSVGSVAGNVAGNVVGSVGSVTGAVGSVTVVSDKTGYRLSSTGVGDILTTALTESYAADGSAATLSQLLYMIMQYLSEMVISGTTMTVKKLDGSTTAYVITMNSATTPTTKTRSS